MSKYGRMMRVDDDFNTLVKEMSDRIAEEVGITQSKKKRRIGSVIITKQIAKIVRRDKEMRIRL
jgi:hypothetical protein